MKLLRNRERLIQLFTPLGAVLAAFLVGALIILILGKNPLTVYARMLSYSFGRVDSIAIIMYRATPLIFTGLAVALSFKIGLFNIGVEGQYRMGVLTAAVAGFAIRGIPAFIHIPLAILAGALGGLLWGLLPILLKLKRGVHEVITTIMTNYIGLNLIHYLLTGPLLDRNQVTGFGGKIMRTPFIAESAQMPKLHGLFSLFSIKLPGYIYLNWFFVIAIILCILVYYLIERTTFGYEVRAVAGNPTAAQTAGINVRSIYLKVFLMSAGIAGLAGLSELMGYYRHMEVSFPSGYGFLGIAVALLGKNSPFGVIIAALLFGFLARGAEGIQILADVPSEVITILQGVIILSIVVAYELVNRYIRIQRKKEAA
ncbi:MAG: ABC transporter permease [Bacillota bacterium]